MKCKLFGVILCIFCLCGCTHPYREEVTQEAFAPGADTVRCAAGAFSNEKYGWGLKRNKNAPPEVPKAIVDMISEQKGVYIGTEEKTLYLTFDEGYENGYTEKILDVLKAENVPAAFFVTGPYLKKETALIARMVNEGHVVGNHTVRHPSMPAVADDALLKREITELNDMFYEQTGQNMAFFRPPMGEYSERTLNITKNLGYTTVFWSFAYRDWETKNQKGTDYAYRMITEGVHDGAVLLLHAVSRDNAEVLQKVIRDLKTEGYVFRSLWDFRPQS